MMMRQPLREITLRYACGHKDVSRYRLTSAQAAETQRWASERECPECIWARAWGQPEAATAAGEDK